MKTISINLVAGARKNIYVLASFFHLMDTISPIDVEFINNGVVYGVAQQVEYGLKAKPEGGFTELGFTSAITQTIKIYIGVGDGSNDRVTGSVQVTNFPAVQGAYIQVQRSLTNVNQVLLAASATRRGALIQNNDAAAVMRVTLNGVAATITSGIRIQPGQSYELPVFAATGDINGIMETATAAANNVEVVSS